MRVCLLSILIAFSLAVSSAEAMGKTASDVERDIPDRALARQVREIMRIIDQWHRACKAGDLGDIERLHLPPKSKKARGNRSVVNSIIEAIKELHLPSKGKTAKNSRAKVDLTLMNAIFEAMPEWRPSFIAVIWDDKKAQVFSQEITLPGFDCPVMIAWEFERLDGRWYLSSEVGAGTGFERFRIREDLFALFDMFIFMQDYPTGQMWFDHPDPKLRFKTNSRRDEAAAFKQLPWPQLDGAPQEVRQIAQLTKEWLAAWLTDDIKRAKALCAPHALRSVEEDPEDYHRVLAGTKGQFFSPMAVKIRSSEAEIISHPMQIDLHGTTGRVVIRVDLREIEGGWKIQGHRGTEVRGLADELSKFARKYPDSLLWIDDDAPEWIKGDGERIDPAFDNSSVDSLIARLRDGNPEVREAALKWGGQALRAAEERKDEILELMDALSRDWDYRVRREVANSVWEYWIYKQEVQEPLAIDIEMRLSRDMHHHDIRGKAAEGLAYVKDKNDEVIMRLVDMVPDWNVDLGQIRRGLQMGADKEKIRMYLQPYLCLEGRPGDRVKDLYKKIFDEEAPNR